MCRNNIIRLFFRTYLIETYDTHLADAMVCWQRLVSAWVGLLKVTLVAEWTFQDLAIHDGSLDPAPLTRRGQQILLLACITCVSALFLRAVADQRHTCKCALWTNQICVVDGQLHAIMIVLHGNSQNVQQLQDLFRSAAERRSWRSMAK